MLRSRLILLVLIAVSVAVLYNLPRVVVDTSESAVNKSTGNAEALIEGNLKQPQAHLSDIPDSVAGTINILRESLFTLHNQEKRLIFADSLAMLFDQVGKYDSAARYYELKISLLESFEQYLETAEACYKAMSFTMDGRLRGEWAEKARKYYEKVLEEDPDLPDVRVKLGMTYLSGNDPMTGIQILRKVSEEYPENELAIYQLGMLSVTTGQYDRAIERFIELVGLNDENGEAHFYLGYSYFEKGEYEKARAQFEKVLSLDVSTELSETAKKYLENINNI